GDEGANPGKQVVDHGAGVVTPLRVAGALRADGQLGAVELLGITGAARDAVTHAAVCLVVVDLVEAHPVEEEPVDLVAREHLVENLEDLPLVVPAARADTGEALIDLVTSV